MLSTIIGAVSTYWTNVLLDGFDAYTKIKAETEGGKDAGKIAVTMAEAGVKEVERFWSTWGDIVTPMAATVVLRVTSTSSSGSTTIPVFPMIATGDLVPTSANPIDLLAVKGAGSGKLTTSVEGFDGIKVSATGLAGMSKGDVYVGLVYRKLKSGDTRPLANVFVVVES